MSFIHIKKIREASPALTSKVQMKTASTNSGYFLRVKPTLTAFHDFPNHVSEKGLLILSHDSMTLNHSMEINYLKYLLKFQ